MESNNQSAENLRCPKCNSDQTCCISDGDKPETVDLFECYSCGHEWHNQALPACSTPHPSLSPDVRERTVFDFVKVLHKRQKQVQELIYWERFIDGTPLSNDLGVMLTEAERDGFELAAELTGRESDESSLSSQQAVLKATWVDGYDGNMKTAARVATIAGLDYKHHPIFCEADVVVAFFHIGEYINAQAGEIAFIRSQHAQELAQLREELEKDESEHARVLIETRNIYTAKMAEFRATLSAVEAERDELKDWRNEAEGKLFECGNTIGQLFAELSALKKGGRSE